MGVGLYLDFRSTTLDLKAKTEYTNFEQYCCRQRNADRPKCYFTQH